MTAARNSGAEPKRPRVQFIEEAGVRKFAILSIEDYEALVADAEMTEDIRAFDEAKAAADEFVPSELTVRLLDGDSPIRVWREYRRMTQSALAAAAGIGQPFLSQLESGKRSPSVSVVRAIARALSIDLDEIVDWLDREKG